MFPTLLVCAPLGGLAALGLAAAAIVFLPGGPAHFADADVLAPPQSVLLDASDFFDPATPARGGGDVSAAAAEGEAPAPTAIVAVVAPAIPAVAQPASVDVATSDTAAVPASAPAGDDTGTAALPSVEPVLQVLQGAIDHPGETASAAVGALRSMLSDSTR
jgi:hypothetical protein